MLNAVNLRRRLLFAVPAIPIGWWGINSNFSLLPGTPYHIVPGMVITIALVIMGGFEYNRMLSVFFPRNAFWLGLTWLTAELVLDMFNLSIPLRFSIFILLLIVAFEAIVWGKRNSGRWRRASLSFSAMVFLYIAGVSILYLFDPAFQSFFRPYGSEMLSRVGFALVIGSILMCDTIAYFAGSIWGRHHYSNISPNKTIEGSIAGFSTAFILFSVLWVFLGSPAYPWYLGIFMGLIVGVFAQVGDLLVSLMKRYFKQKNASEYLPGHGGVLDRFGSIFVAVPTLGLFLLAFATNEYVQTLDEYLRLVRDKRYEEAYAMTGRVNIECKDQAGAAVFLQRGDRADWTKQQAHLELKKIGKIQRFNYWEKDSTQKWECQSALGLHCFKIKALYKLNETSADKTGEREEWQTRLVWLGKGADSKIRILSESGESQ
ncbi:MAG TPA: phosphatidate cytidylyltransferase [Chitinivibrionales bacterium]|nr:phosphatidate cytidylyltransferase [Chitinivibrionales bacterium]